MHTLAVFPTYDGSRCNGKVIWDLARTSEAIDFCEPKSSFLTLTFNSAWAQALSNRESGITHFLMVHSDIIPLSPRWYHTMVAEMERTDADVISVVSPLKSNRGLTSVARDTDAWSPQRYTIKEINALPETWTATDLLFNTGLMLVDFRKPWVEMIEFQVNNRIRKQDDLLGQWVAESESEDWNFSRQCRMMKLRCFVTRRVLLNHSGQADYPNFGEWGLDHDLDVKGVEQLRRGSIL